MKKQDETSRGITQKEKHRLINHSERTTVFAEAYTHYLDCFTDNMDLLGQLKTLSNQLFLNSDFITETVTDRAS